jgi:hypothetical protein
MENGNPMHEEVSLTPQRKSHLGKRKLLSRMTNPKHIVPTLQSLIDNEIDLDLPDNTEEVGAILAEMVAQQALFEVSFQEGSLERAILRVREALELQPQCPDRFETKLLIFCLNHCLGKPKEGLIPDSPTGTKWSQRTFEALAIGWMKWVTTGDKAVLSYISRMNEDEPGEGDKAVETLSLSFWAKAIEMLVLGRLEDSKRFFERANEVGANYGTRTNPSICWTYVTSFFTTT